MSASDKIQIAVLGASGQMGCEFQVIAKNYPDLSFDFFDKSTADITQLDSLVQALKRKNYHVLINCAAYTAVDKAESEPQLCYDVNTLGCQNIVDVLKGCDTKIVHFSTDYVYNSYNGFPIEEDAPKNPQSVYAKSKLEGETILRESDIPTLIIRTSWVFSSFGHNFVKTMIRLGKEKTSIQVVNDQYGAPTYARHLAQTTLDIILNTHNNTERFNATYNYANEGLVTWYDIADRIMKDCSLNCRVLPITTAEYPTSAQRPPWSVLSKHKIKETFNTEIPHWYSALKECLSELI